MELPGASAAARPSRTSGYSYAAAAPESAACDPSLYSTAASADVLFQISATPAHGGKPPGSAEILPCPAGLVSLSDAAAEAPPPPRAFAVGGLCSEDSARGSGAGCSRCSAARFCSAKEYFEDVYAAAKQQARCRAQSSNGPSGPAATDCGGHSSLPFDSASDRACRTLQCTPPQPLRPEYAATNLFHV